MTDKPLFQFGFSIVNKKTILVGDFVSFWMNRKFEINEWGIQCSSDEILGLENNAYKK